MNPIKSYRKSDKSAFCQAAFFIAIIAVITVISLLKPQKSFSETENRYLTGRPEFNWQALVSGEFGTEYEKYLADQFMLRDTWIGIKTAAERIRGMKEINNVYFGRDGYLIEKVSAADFEGAQAAKNVQYLAEFIQHFSETEDGTKKPTVSVLLVPTAEAALKEKLPAAAPAYDQQQWLAQTKNLCPGANWVPTEMLPDGGTGQLYYRTDHHWTTHGAYMAYEAWAKSVGLTPYREEDFDIRTVTEQFLGTTQARVNTYLQPDHIQMYTPKEGGASFEIQVEGERQARDDFYHWESLETKDKYAFFMGGNYGKVTVTSRSHSTDARRLLLIKDSYANCFLPFAALHFDEIVMVDLRHLTTPLSNILEQEQFNDILILYGAKKFAADRNIYKLSR